ncbi:hypothetical protein MNBD_CHLOROFLEXI01-4575 [hydrothermal vent metagenome]|uniref:Uncharacterized protein n=1 Tax=hydrothermal vent metagenome TaxID=652676 RepID=A0A3B0VES7_9ZZZZ
MLEEHKLIQVVDVNVEKGIVEKTYQVTARQFKIRNPILVGEELPVETASALLGGFRKIIEGNHTVFRNPLEAFSD